MNHRPTARIETVWVSAVIQGETARLIDRDGRKVGSAKLSRLEPVSADIAVACLWQVAAKRLVDRFDFYWLKNVGNAWEQKARCLATSLRLRMKGRPGKGGRRRFDKYGTTAWPEAAKRMVSQGYNRAKRHDRSGWVLWSHTVSSNQNKRAEARYG